MWRFACLCVILMVGTVAIYWPVGDFDFVSHDDDLYVYANRHVMAGLTGESVRWALTSQVVGNWHPLTMLSHMLDVELGGRRAGAHHLTSVALHTINVLLLFGAIRSLTGSTWRSAAVAAAFAWHPLNIETVAWVSQRKSLLSTMFWLASMWAYVRYVRLPGVKRYLPVVLLMTLGLMCKPMLVTLPCALLLLDVWPLQRTATLSIKRLVVEKLPLLAISGLFSAITLVVQGQAGALGTSQKMSFAMRAVNTLVSYLRYLDKLVWPRELAVPYPLPTPLALDMWPTPLIVTAVLVLLAVTCITVALANRREYRYVAVGWFWYLGVLVPVIGLFVQQGSQAMADRFMYVPMIGLLVAVVWGAADLTRAWKGRAVLGSAAALLVLSALAGATVKQLPHWRNTISLFEHAVEVTEDNLIAHLNLGLTYFAKHDYQKAADHFRRCGRINPLDRNCAMMYGVALTKLGRYDRAVRQLTETLRMGPGRDLRAEFHLAVALAESGHPDRALVLFERVLPHRPNDPELRAWHARVLAALGRADEIQPDR